MHDAPTTVLTPVLNEGPTLDNRPTLQFWVPLWPMTDPDEEPPLALLERVLAGLRRGRVHDTGRWLRKRGGSGRDSRTLLAGFSLA